MPYLKVFDLYVSNYKVDEQDGRPPFIYDLEYDKNRDKATLIPSNLISRVLAVARRSAAIIDPADINTMVHVTTFLPAIAEKAPKSLPVEREFIDIDAPKLRFYFMKKGITMTEVGRLMGLTGSALHNVGRIFDGSRKFPRSAYKRLSRTYPSISYYVIRHKDEPVNILSESEE